ncbi:fibronectin type III domain-containing protein [Actinokineospora fastidiosa]|uniref:Fibronectin type-III domain-containing protein n=1 Tax=Actinokineospora fastidiosa TaxID=1816 RepID=A0A918LF84_9PSEU|nr:fibronectin type III domain-containing protein [Actinokineospora fastidiosa]GGS41757.1 hypothetical protein GCM10010171_40580 [Actinokineospora fastidiosa]
MVFAAIGPAAAEPVSLTQNHRCAFPLIGERTVPVIVSGDIPAYAAIGDTVETYVGVGVRFTEEDLGFHRPDTIGGTARLEVTIDKPDGDHVVTLPVDLADRDVPQSGGFTIHDSVRLPAVTVTAPGEIRFHVRSADLVLRVRKGGEGYDSACTAEPADTLLGTVRAPTPAAPVTRTLDHDCALPLIGNQRLAITVAVEIPDTAPRGEPIGPLPFTVRVEFTEQATQAFRLIGAGWFRGTADMAVDIQTPAGVRRTTAAIRFVETAIPESGRFTVEGTGWHPPVTFTDAGVNRFVLADSTIHMRLRSVNPSPDPPETVPVTCRIVPGQDPLLAEVVTPGEVGPPVDLTVVATTHDSVHLAWKPPAGPEVAGYRVSTGDQVSDVEDTEAIVRGLAPDTDHTIRVVSLDAAGNASEPAQITARTRKAEIAYTLSGETTIKASRATVPLTGRVDATLGAADTYTADVTLDPTTARLTVLGVLPVEANVVFMPATSAGGLADGTLTTRTSVGVTVPGLTVLGFPIALHPACGTIVDLAVSAPFDPAAGGVLTGGYTLPPLTGCGRLTDLVNHFAAGPGNTVSVTLSPAAS